MSEPTDLGHLAQNRREIAIRSAMAGAIGLVPVPFLDDYLTSRVRADLIRRLANLRMVDVSPEAVKILASERQSALFRGAQIATLAASLTRHLFRKLLVALTVAHRADEMARSFQLALLFDHYCARIHVGPAVTAEAAARLRAAIDAAIAESRSDLVSTAFRSAITSSTATLAKLPGALAQVAQRMLAGERSSQKGAETAAGDGGAGATDGGGGAGSAPEGAFADVGQGVEERLGAAGGEVLASLVRRFEAKLRAGEGAPPPPGEQESAGSGAAAGT